jgi:hypothetical protein
MLLGQFHRRCFAVKHVCSAFPLHQVFMAKNIKIVILDPEYWGNVCHRNINIQLQY